LIIACNPPGALFGRGDRRISFTERDQHFHRQSFEPPFPVDAFLCAGPVSASNAERRAPASPTADPSKSPFSKLAF
jgi:hypothetical protein